MPGSVGIALLLAALSADPAPVGDTVYYDQPPRAMQPLVLQNAPYAQPQQAVVIPNGPQPQEALPAAHAEPVQAASEPGRLAAPVSSSKPPLALAPPGGGAKRAESPKASSGSRAIGTALGSLSVVVGLFLLTAWLMRRHMPKSARPLPSEAVEVFGRITLASRHSAQLLRVGNKMLLVSISPDGVAPLTEITDAAEVERLAGLCRQRQSDSVSETFRQVFAQLGTETTTRRGKGGRADVAV